jgi:hypothetical protein
MMGCELTNRLKIAYLPGAVSLAIAAMALGKGN